MRNGRGILDGNGLPSEVGYNEPYSAVKPKLYEFGMRHSECLMVNGKARRQEFLIAIYHLPNSCCGNPRPKVLAVQRVHAGQNLLALAPAAEDGDAFDAFPVRKKKGLAHVFFRGLRREVYGL
jgi:hypothetical protein